MKSIEGILSLVEQELQTIVNNGRFRSREEIDTVYKLMDVVKDAHCIWAYEQEEEGGYSEDGGSYDRSYRGSYRSYEGSNDGGMSGARGRSARRDSMGRYSREGSRGSYRSYSRDDNKQAFAEELRNLMKEAPDEPTKQSLQRMISLMES